MLKYSVSEKKRHFKCETLILNHCKDWHRLHLSELKFIIEREACHLFRTGTTGQLGK